MDFANLNADKNLILTKHFTEGRGGHSINKVILHHNAGNLSIEGCHSVWQNREASAHYQVQSDGQIGQLVWDRDTAWHAGNFAANQTSIGIEHADCQSNPWRISDAALDAGAHLTAAICKYYKLGRPTWGKNVFGHSDFASTECPASLAVGGSQHDAYMSKAQAYYDQMTGTASSSSSSASASSTKSVEEVAREVIAGSWGNGDDRKAKLQAAGYDYSAVQAKVNELLGASSSSSSQSVDIDQLARDVIAGKYGNGDARKAALGSNYSAVQARVNQMLGASSASSGKSIDTLAREVIAGKWGNGQARKDALTAAGYDYNAVQARVNQLL